MSCMNRFAAPALNGAKQSGTEQRAAAALNHHAAQHCKHKAFSQVPRFDPFTFLPEPGWASCPCLSLTLSKSQTLPDAVIWARSVGESPCMLPVWRPCWVRRRKEGIWLQVQSWRHQGKLTQNVACYVHFILSDHQGPLDIIERVALSHQLGDFGIHVLMRVLMGSPMQDLWRGLARKGLRWSRGCLQTISSHWWTEIKPGSIK